MTGTPDNNLFGSPLHIINVGADLFAHPLASQGAPLIRVTWQPAAGNTDAALSMLLGDERADRANHDTSQRMITERPRLRDVPPAHEALPPMHTRLPLH